MRIKNFKPFVTLLFLVVAFCNSTYSAMKDTNQLNPGDRLNAEESIRSDDKVYEMRMQGDCNLVIYKNRTGDLPQLAQAYTNTQGKGSHCYLEMQTDGNLVIYDSPRRPVWYSNTQNHPGPYARLLPSPSHGHLIIVYGDTTIWNCGKMPVPCPSNGDRNF